MSSEKANKKVLVGVVIWLVIIMVVGAGVKLVFFPAQKSKLEQETGSSSQYTRGQLRLATDSFSGYCILRSDNFKGRLKSLGVKLVVEDDQADYIARINSLKDGSVDMAVFTVDSLIASSAAIGDMPGTIIAVIDESKGADAIIAYDGVVSQLQDLDSPNVKIVLTPSSPSEFLTRVVMSHFSVSDLENRWEEANGSTDVLKKFRTADKSQKEAFVMWQPEVAQALELSGAKVLLDSSKLSGYILDVLVVRREYLRDNEELVREVTEAYFRSAHDYNQEADGMKELVIQDAKEFGGQKLSDKQATELVAGVEWKNVLENYAHFGLLSGQESKGLKCLEDAIGDISKVLVSTGAISSNPVAGRETSLFFDVIMSDMQTASFHPGRATNLLVDQAGLGLSGEDMAEIRGVEELPELSEEQWNKLISVGQMRIKPITFGRGRAKIGIQAQRDLVELTDNLGSWPEYYLMIVGHASAKGDMDANLALAKKRSQAVAEYLLSGGVSENRVRAVAANPSGEGAASQSVTFVLGQMPY